MFAVKCLSPAVAAVIALLPAGPGAAQARCEGPGGPVACAEVRLAGGYYRRYPPPRYYPPYQAPRYTAPQRYPYRPYYEPSYEPSYQPYYDPAYGADYPVDLIEKIQAGLDYLGYDPGPIDGVFGGLTSQAIGEFQADAGLAVDGRPSDQLYASLERYLPPGE
jgi:hypothetical protein